MARRNATHHMVRKKNRTSHAKKNPKGRKRRWMLNPQHPSEIMRRKAKAAA